MRAIIIIILIVAVMVIGGWLVINFGNNSATVELRTDKIKQDTSKMVDEAKETFQRAGDAIEGAVERP